MCPGEPVSLLIPPQRKSLQKIIELHSHRLPPVEDRLHDLRRQQGEPQNPAHQDGAARFARARSSSVACTPASKSVACVTPVTLLLPSVHESGEPVFAQRAMLPS